MAGWDDVTVAGWEPGDGPTDVAEPDVAEPDVAEPDVAEPDVAEPDVPGPLAVATATGAGAQEPTALDDLLSLLGGPGAPGAEEIEAGSGPCDIADPDVPEAVAPAPFVPVEANSLTSDGRDHTVDELPTKARSDGSEPVDLEEPFSAVAPAPTYGGATNRPSLADARAKREAASLSDAQTAEVEHAAVIAAVDARLAGVAHLWPTVDKILGYLAGEHDLQVALADVIITRDVVVDHEQRSLVENLIRPRLAQADVALVNERDIQTVFDLLYDEWTGISSLGPLWRDDDITEIMIDAWDSIIIEKDGALEPTPVVFRSKQHALEVARNLSQKVSDRAVNESNPIVTAELPGARLHFAVGKVVKSGLSVSIRKFRPLMGIDKLLEYDALNQEMVDFLADAIGKGRANTLVSGGTGTGKTTMLNAVSSFIPATERVVTIEDNFELTLQNELVVAMQTKEAASADSKSSVSMGDLLRSSLRMRPDRIVVGEIRGAEAAVMLQAANTGHDGTMSTIHANDAAGCVSVRLPDMLQQARAMPDAVARRQVASAIDLVVQITRQAGRRFVSAIATVDITDIRADSIEPHTLFTGTLGKDGKITFRRTGALRTDTELALKMSDHGADVARWAAMPEES
jgi:pilus assembly protein CpaF